MSEYASVSEFAIAIERAFKPFRVLITGLSPEQLEGPTDEAGWTVRDHIAHVTAWQDGITAIFQGRPRHEGMGIAEEDMDFDNIDHLNAKVREAHASMPAEDVVEEAIMKHEGFMMELESLPEDAVKRKRSDYIPGPDPNAMSFTEWVWNNSGGHYGEHLTYIKRILGEDA